MLFSRLAPLSLVLGAVGYVNASPLSKAGSAAPRALVETCTQPKRCDLPPPHPPCSDDDTINAALVKYRPKVSVFWGGHYTNASIEPQAADCAKKYTGSYAATIGMVLCQNSTIAMPKSGPSWDRASKRFAELAQGRGLVALGKVPFDVASFFNIEFPALKLNTDVKDIVSIDVGNHCQETCVWHCNENGGKCPQGTNLCIIQTDPPNTPPPKHP